MSSIDIILGGYALVLTCAGIVQIYLARTRTERAENTMHEMESRIVAATQHKNDQELTDQYIDLHRKVTELQTFTENLNLRMTDTQDILERRFNRLRVRQSRERAEEGEVEEPVDEEAQLALLQELNGATPEQQPQPRRGRLVAKHGRDKYTRR